MIFISGIHGVGKSYLCKKLKEVIGIESYASSSLIEQKKKIIFAADKKIADIDSNQNYLLAAVEELEEKNSFFVLDGHFCLLDEKGTITRIPEQVFVDLKPTAVVLLTEKVEIIAERRMSRDRIEIDLETTYKFQEAEVAYAKEIAEKLGVPLKISKGYDEIEETIEFIKEQG